MMLAEQPLPEANEAGVLLQDPTTYLDIPSWHSGAIAAPLLAAAAHLSDWGCG